MLIITYYENKIRGITNWDRDYKWCRTCTYKSTYFFLSFFLSFFLIGVALEKRTEEKAKSIMFSYLL